MGPAGTGKSLVVIVFLVAAVARGEKAAMFVFDEELGLLMSRMKGLGIDLERMRQSGQLFIEQVDAAEISPGEFAHMVRKRVDEDDIKTVVIDSLNGYQAAMPEENSLILHIHELLQYLNRRGAATFMTVAQHGLVGDMKAPVDVTYLADTVILLRYFEALGTVRRAMSIIKKRTGAHESTIREYRIDGRGLTIGQPLDGFQGVLRGVPVYVGEDRPLLARAVAVKPGASSERAVILAPTGRDAAVAAALIKEAGHYANVCDDLPALLREIEAGAGLAVIADEAIKTADLRGLVRWLNDQPPWSDFPIVLLTRQGGGPERNPDAVRLGQVARQRHLHRAPVSSDHAGERRRLRGPRPAPPVSDPRHPRGSHRERRPAADRAERRPSRRAGTASAGVRARGLRHLQGVISDAGRTSRSPIRTLLASVHPDDRARRLEVLEATIKTGKDYSIEYRNIWPDGSQHWVDVRARAVRRPDGSIKSLVGVSSDITARKTAEIERENLLTQLAAERTALAELTATLEQRVEQRTADLMKEVAAREKAQEQLRQAQKMETIGQLTGGVAHDFNNLLMAVMGNLDLLRKRMPERSAAAPPDRWRAAGRRARRVADAAAAGVRAPAGSCSAVPIDLRALIQGMIDLLERSLGPRVALRLDLPEGLPPARDRRQPARACDPQSCHQRARRHAGWRLDRDQGLGISGEAAIRRCSRARYLKLSVIDTGTGMTPEILKRAIEPFFSSKPLGKGTGLGLSMVHGLAVQLGGALQLSSTVGKGTTATLMLPVATAAAGSRKPGSGAAEGKALGGDPVRRRRSADRAVDHRDAGRPRPPRDRRQLRAGTRSTSSRASSRST